MDPTHFPPRTFPSIPPPNPPLQLHPPPPPPADLHGAISNLKSLISLASSTLSSLPFLSPPPHPPTLLPCPYNPHHLLPPESLYRHFLNCPSPLPYLPSVPPLEPQSQVQQNGTSFPPTSSDSDSDTDFFFSLESEIGDRGLEFFYKDCPGVVTTVPESARSFTLPGFLLSECCVSGASENGTSSGKSATILPSEYWSLRNEVEAWQSFPVSYSYTAVRAILGFTTVSEDDLKKWVTCNSPKYGIIIDVAVRDHIWLLLKVCLKVVRREALSSMDTLLGNEVFDPKFLLRCPKLSRSFAWFSNQLSILYGEGYARSFSLSMIKEAIVKSGFCVSISKFGERGGEIDKRQSGELTKEGACNGNVLVSQVASAIGALHQRAYLEENIRALRSTQPVAKHHRLMEYVYLSSRATDERSKRPNYKHILDHDSLPSNRVRNQETGGAKSKEELLAEERDYKRRRTSYRGKKVKRSPTEVLRDIIEDHMDVIKQAASIGTNQTSTEYLSSEPDNSKKSTASDTFSFHNSLSHRHDKSYKRGSRYEREDGADTHYSRSHKERDDWYTSKEKRRDDADHYASTSYSEHEDRYRIKGRDKEHRSRRSESVDQDTFDDRYDACRDREEKRRHHRYD